MKANIKKQAQEKKSAATVGALLKARAIIEQNADEKVDISLSLKMFKFKKQTDDAIEFYQKRINEILRQYGEKDKDGKQQYDEKGNALIDKNHLADCRTAILEVEQCEMEKPEVLFEVDELKELKLSMNDIAVLEDFIKKE